MVDATNPQAGVGQAAPSVENRLAAFLSREEQEQAAPEPEQTQPEAAPEANPEPVEAQASEDGLTPEDLPDDGQDPTPQSAEGSFEIVHNGTQHKLTREETIKLAQQGFDYTQKTQQVAAQTKALDAALQRTAELEQIAPMLAQEQAQVVAIKSQLDQYKDVDWVKLATEQPLDYPRYRAQYDLMVNAYNQGVHNLNQAANEVARRREEITATVLQQESQRLRELIPEWADPVKYKAGAQEVADYLVSEGVPREEVAGLNNAIAVKLARKAMLYDKLLKSKGEKAKLLQTAPPVSRPGVNPSRDAARADKETEMRTRLKKTGDIKDAAALLATRLR